MNTRSIKRAKNSKPVKVVLNRGLNETHDFSSMAPGELITCDNYNILDSTITGATSCYGFDRVDGMVRTITNPVNPTEQVDVVIPSDVPVVWNSNRTDADDTERELIRADIQSLPVDDKIIGFFELSEEVFIFAVDKTSSEYHIYSLNSGVGIDIDLTIPAYGNADLDDLYYTSMNGRLSFFPASNPNNQIALVTTRQHPALLFYLDANGALNYHEVVSSSLPADNRVTVANIFNNRLFLFFRGGHGFHSDVGNPDEFDSAVSSAGEWNFGSEVTDTLVMSASFIIAMERGVDIISLTDPNLVTGVDMVKEQYSTTVNVIPGTMKNYYGAAFYCGVKGIGLIESTADTGSFDLRSLTTRIQKTYSENYQNILACNVNRVTSQYEIYFKNGFVLYLTLNQGKQVKSIGRRTFQGRNISAIYQMKNKEVFYLTFEGDTFCYTMRKECTSYDGAPINTELLTAFSAYGAPSIFKSLTSVGLNFSSESGQIFSVQSVFDFEGEDAKVSNPVITKPVTPKARYGSSRWDERRYASSSIVNDVKCYVYGVGENIAVRISTSSKFHSQHTIHYMLMMIRRLGIHS